MGRKNKKELEDKKKQEEEKKKKELEKAKLKKKLLEKKKEEKNKAKKECQSKINEVLDKSLKLKDEELIKLPLEVKISEAVILKSNECKDVPKLHSKIDEKIKQLRNKRNGIIKLREQKKELEEKKKKRN